MRVEIYLHRDWFDILPSLCVLRYGMCVSFLFFEIDFWWG